MHAPNDSHLGDAPLESPVQDSSLEQLGENAAVHALKHEVQKGRMSFTAAVEAFERDLICDALERARHIQTRAARLLGITRRILKYRMDALGIPVRRARGRVQKAA